MANLISSRVVAFETPPGPATIEGVPTNIAGFVGVTRWGPVNVSTRVHSFDEFRDVFGGYTLDSELPQTVIGFFTGGGTECEIIRTVHVTDVTDPASKTSVAATLDLNTAATAPTAAILTGSIVGPWSFSPGDDLSIDVDGGGAALATFDATAGDRTSGNTEDFVLADLQTLDISVDGAPAQTVTFLNAEFANILLAKAQEVANVINAKATGLFAADVAGAVIVTSDRKGTGSSIEITGGTAAGAFAFPGGAGSGTGDVSDISAVTDAEIKAVVEADIAGLTVSVTGGGLIQITSNSTGLTSTLQVAVGAVQIALGLSTATVSGTDGTPLPTITVDGLYDGSRANAFQIRIASASNGDALLFNLSIVEDGIQNPAEIFPNLSLESTSVRFVETIVNDTLVGSKLVTVTYLEPSTPTPRPDDGLFGPLTGGDDGLVGLVDADFIGGKSLANGTTGLRSFDRTDVSMFAIPGRATSIAHNGMITYADEVREGLLFAQLDLPPALEPDGVVTYMTTTAALTGLSTFGAADWPRLLINNPEPSIFGNGATLEIPNSGSVLGRYSQTDLASAGGIYEFSAGPNVNGTLSGVVGLANDVVLDREARDIIVPAQVNPINGTLGSGGAVTSVYIDGTRTLKEDADFERIATRRGLNFIKASIVVGVDPFRHQANTRQLRQKIGGVIDQFLREQMGVGAFASNEPVTAFSIDVSDNLNTSEVQASKRILVKIKLAMNEPADFIILEFGPLAVTS